MGLMIEQARELDEAEYIDEIERLSKEVETLKAYKTLVECKEMQNLKLRRQITHAVVELAKPRPLRRELTKEEWLILLGNL